MKKTFVTFILVSLFILTSSLSSFADGVIPDERLAERLTDDADLLDDSDEEELLYKLDSLSEEYRMDIVVVTVNSIEGKTPVAFADDFFDYNGFGYGDTEDGILLLVNMGERDWYISTCGRAQYTFTDYGLEYMGDEVLYWLGDGYYYDAFDTFADICEELILYELENGAYDVDNLPKPVFKIDLLSVIIGFVIALIISLIMRSKHKSVRFSSQAGDYMKKDSFALTQCTDLFLYRNVTRTRRETESSSSGGSSMHRSSSGRSHGGRGGKF